MREENVKRMEIPNEKAIHYSFMIGVLPGYGHENEALTPESTMVIGKKAVAQAYSEEQKQCLEQIRLASAVYPTAFGCPQGGELGVQVEGTCASEAELQGLIETIKKMMKGLGQSTVTVEIVDSNGRRGNMYISKNGENIEWNTEAANSPEHYSVKIPQECVGFTELGHRLQEAMNIAENRGKYITSGVLVSGVDENGRAYYEYSGTQNPAYGQTDREKYQRSAYATIALATEELTNSVVEFNNEGVIVEKQEIRREKEKEPEIEM